MTIKQFRAWQRRIDHAQRAVDRRQSRIDERQQRLWDRFTEEYPGYRLVSSEEFGAVLEREAREIAAELNADSAPPSRPFAEILRDRKAERERLTPPA